MTDGAGHVRTCLFLTRFIISFLLIPRAEAFCGVHRRKGPLHQVADGEGAGLGHCVGCWGKLQSGCMHCENV